MTKAEFMDHLEDLRKKYKFNIRAEHMEFVLSPRYLFVSACPTLQRETLTVRGETNQRYSKRNLAILREAISEHADIFTEWKSRHAEWKKTPEFRDLQRQREIRQIAVAAGCFQDDSWGNLADYYRLSVEDYVYKKTDMRRYHATGKYLALVGQKRTRHYAKSSDYRESTRIDKFVVGINENGNPFRHQVPTYLVTLRDAVNWIWGDVKIEARQGDIAIAPSKLKHVSGEESCDYVIDSHILFAEIYRNGGLHARRGFLVHESGQHPPIYLGSEWKRIVVARRSELGMSSAD